jgi:hypothetical protein
MRAEDINRQASFAAFSILGSTDAALMDSAPERFSALGTRIGVDYVTYALTH